MPVVCVVVYVHRVILDWSIKAVVCLLCVWGSVCTSSDPRLEYQGSGMPVVCVVVYVHRADLSSHLQLDSSFL